MENGAFGAPGIPPRWTSSKKDGVGTALSSRSRVWFTISHGIVNEVYYPRIDIANTRDHQFLIASDDFFSEERKDTIHSTNFVVRGVPAYVVKNESVEGMYSIKKTIFTDPSSDVLIQRVSFRPRRDLVDKLRLYSLLAPHVGNSGFENDSWTGEYKGIPMMFAGRSSTFLAACADTPCLKMSCGYSGFSDGWQDISRNKKMTWEFNSARNGNVALTCEVSVPKGDEFTFFIGFGETPEEAALKVRNVQMKDYNKVLEEYVSQWVGYNSKMNSGRQKELQQGLYDTSVAVIKVHQAKDQFPGALIASLSIPWGTSKGDDDMGGYHLVWPRDMVEAAQAMIVVGDTEGAISALNFLEVTQEKDGHWPQNMWLDGKSHWSGVQIDETAFPILLADKLRRMNVIDPRKYWDMIYRASKFLLISGPSTQQDRWEEDGGYSPFTIAVEIAALLSAADFASFVGQKEISRFLLESADSINSNIERWTYTTGTDLAKRLGVEGYYVRIAPPDRGMYFASSAMKGYVPIKNKPPGSSEVPAEEIVSTDALALVRFGLRSADDPKIVSTVKVIDSILKIETRRGPVWHRYNYDGYGEHEDGTPFDGTGIGRGWPLLVGERAHYEISRGNLKEAMQLKKAMESQSSPGGMIPEQIWDSVDIPRIGLRNGSPSGSAMPLIWAHAEYIKLAKSIEEGAVVDTPPQAYERYITNKISSKISIWSTYNKFNWLEEGRTLRIETTSNAIIHWSSDNWKTVQDSSVEYSGIGVFYLDLPTELLKSGDELKFTIYFKDTDNWLGEDFSVKITSNDPV